MRVILATTILLLAALPAGANDAQEFVVAASTNPAALRAANATIERMDAARNRLQQRPQGKPRPTGDVRIVCDAAHVGLFFTPDGPTRYVAVHLLARNTGKEAVTVSRKSIAARIDGEAHKVAAPEGPVASAGFHYGREHVSLQAMTVPESWDIPAGGVHGLWLAFTDLSAGGQVPHVEITLDVGDAEVSIDMNADQHAALDPRTERLGPKNLLAVYTVGGMLNAVNAQSLVDDLAALAEQDVSRIVVTWSKSAPVPDGQILSWLQNSAIGAGLGASVSETLPPLPGAIRELHLTRFADQEFPSNDYGARPEAASRVHSSLPAAVSAALRSLIAVLPAKDLAAEIRSGHPWSRAAALEYGGPRLGPEVRPALLELATSEEPAVRRAAVLALGSFGDEQSIELLAEWCRTGPEPLADAAAQALAKSRFREGQEALKTVLRNSDAARRRRLVGILANSPRPIWADELYRAATSEAAPSKELLLALVQLGHPQVVDLLEAALTSEDSALRDFALQTLAQRADERSERIAADYILERLKSSPPDAVTVQLLARTRDPRSAPLLLQHLDRPGDHTAVINLLGQLADSKAIEEIAARYAKLSVADRAAALTALKSNYHPRFLPLAGEALTSGEHHLVATAAQALSQDGSTAACRLLVDALPKQQNNFLASIVCSTLGQMSQPEARTALIKERQSSDPQRRLAAQQGLSMWRQRSPAYLYVFQAQQHVLSEELDDASELFDLALEADAELPEAHTGRGNLMLRKGDLKEAEISFNRALELEPESAEGVTGAAVVQVQTGRIAAGIELLERHRERFAEANLFLYNSACVYARAAEAASNDQSQKETAARYREQALKDLEASLDQGFDQIEWMVKDPDLVILHDEPRFKELAKRTAGGG